MDKNNHLHFIIWACENKVGDNYQGITYVDVIEDTVDDAMKRARKLCPNKKIYWLNNIVEHQPHAHGEKE